MENLNKTQLILLALLVSFVTSIATGIITVSLVNQAPPSVTQTISRVIEKTEQIIVPGKTQTITERIIVKEEDSIVSAVQKNSPNIIRVGFLKEGTKTGEDQTQGGQATSTAKQSVSFEAFATGFVLSPDDGIAIASIKDLKGTEQLIAQTLDGVRFMVTPLTEATSGLVFIRLEKFESSAKTPKEIFRAVEFTDSEALEVGQNAIALGANGGLQLLKGVISHFDKETFEEKDGEGVTITSQRNIVIHTTLAGTESFWGGPLFSTNGAVIGVGMPDSLTYSAIPARIILDILEEIQNPPKKATDVQVKGEQNVAATENASRP